MIHRWPCLRRFLPTGRGVFTRSAQPATCGQRPNGDSRLVRRKRVVHMGGNGVFLGRGGGKGRRYNLHELPCHHDIKFKKSLPK